MVKLLRVYYFEIIASMLATSLIGSLSYFFNPISRALLTGSITLLLSISLFLLNKWSKLFNYLIKNSHRINDVDGLMSSMIEAQTVNTLKQSKRSWGIGRDITLTNEDQLHEFVTQCFERCRGKKYIGTDRHLPSDYTHLYPHYMQVQKDNILENDSLRVVLYSESQLMDDYENNPGCVQTFLEYNSATGTRLLSCPFNAADTKCELDTLDIGIFGDSFVVLFFPEDIQKRIVTVRVEKMRGHMSTKVWSYINKLVYDNNVKKVTYSSRSGPTMQQRSDKGRINDIKLFSKKT